MSNDLSKCTDLLLIERITYLQRINAKKLLGAWGVNQLSILQGEAIKRKLPLPNQKPNQ